MLFLNKVRDPPSKSEFHWHLTGRFLVMILCPFSGRFVRHFIAETLRYNDPASSFAKSIPVTVGAPRAKPVFNP